MSEQEKADILKTISSLPERDKQFILGYASGINAAAAEQKKTEAQEKADPIERS